MLLFACNILLIIILNGSVVAACVFNYEINQCAIIYMKMDSSSHNNNLYLLCKIIRAGLLK